MEQLINIISPDVRPNLFGTYAELRRRGPVCRIDPGGMWAVTRYADVINVLKNPGLFSSKLEALARPTWLPNSPLAGSVVFEDPPLHTGLRALIAPAFSPRGLERLAPRVRAYVDDLLSRFSTDSPVEFVSEFALPLPSLVICELLGLDPGLYKHFKRWADAVMSISPEEPSKEVADELRATLGELNGYLDDVVAARTRSPSDDVASHLAHANVEGRSLTRQETRALLFAILIAGFETTTQLLGSALHTLTERPQDFARLRADPSRLPAFIDEALRYRPPNHALFRYTTDDVSIGEVRIPRGSIVYVMIASALHDEQEFPDPERFDMDRGASSAAAFGHGIHFCIGSALAKLEGRIALEALLSRFTGVALVPGGIEWQNTIWSQGLSKLPLAFSR